MCWETGSLCINVLVVLSDSGDRNSNFNYFFLYKKKCDMRARGVTEAPHDKLPGYECEEPLTAHPFILQSEHDTVSMLHSVEEDPNSELVFTVLLSPGAQGPNEVRSELY